MNDRPLSASGFLIGLGAILRDSGLREAARTDLKVRAKIVELWTRRRELAAAIDDELKAGPPRGLTARTTRCPACERARQRRRDARRGTPAERGYDHAYRTRRAEML
ncbi:MAG: hypothetical protein PVH07_11435 [Chloroflexota bacterium]|jgi:hypothetical protein